jgi:hypothetical protein
MLSQLLDAKSTTLTAEDLASIAPEDRQVLLSHRILAAGRPAMHVACNACHEDHVEEVVRVKDKNGLVFFRIPCPEAGWVDVPQERMKQWTLDTTRLVALLAEATSKENQPDEVLPGLAWKLGTVNLKGDSYDVVFVRNREQAFETLTSELEKNLAPTSTVIIWANLSIVECKSFAASLPMTTAFAIAENQFEFQLKLVQSHLSRQSIVAENVFKKRGEFWQLSFGGDTTFLKDSVGLGYIARLLIEPNREIPAVTLLAARTGIDPLVASGSSGEVLDDQARKEYSNRYRELQEYLQEARDDNDDGRVAKLEAEMEQLTNELASAVGLGGRSREKSDIEKVRKSVSMAVSRDIERIGDWHAMLGRHLTASIHSGLTFRYAPEAEIEWLT